MIDQIELPKGWKWIKLKEVAEMNPQIPNKQDIDPETEIQFLPMKLVSEVSGIIQLTEIRKYGEVLKGYTPFINGDVIFAKVTPCMENGKIAVVDNLTNGIGFGSSEFHVLRTQKLLSNKFLFFFLVQSKFRKEAENSMTGAVGLRRVPKQFLENCEIPLPPLPEQHRIVTKIEELFSQLDNGIAQLKTAQAQLKVYRQAVLKWAFEGKLTNVGVQEGVLPEGWRWVKVSQIGKVETGSTPSKQNPEFYSNDFPFYKPTDLEAGYNVRSASDGLSKSGIEQARFLPENSVLVTCIGATIGKTGIIRKGGASNQQINAIIPTNDHNPNFIYYQAIGLKFQKDIKDNASATTLPILNKSKFQNLEMVICPLSEQHRIVQEIESRLSVCDKLEESIGQGLQQAEALRQSILKRAFEGKLVAGEAALEPAAAR